MAKYRIIEETFHPGTEKEYKKYLVQKRFLGFLWWFDPYDDGWYCDGYFDSYEEAFNLFEKIEKADPLQTVIIVERIADTEITDKTQLVEGKKYWVAAD